MLTCFMRKRFTWLQNSLQLLGSLPLRLSFAVTTVHSVTNEEGNDFSEQEKMQYFLSWLNKSMSNEILNTVIVILLPAFVNAHRRKLYQHSFILHLSIPFIPFSYIILFPEIFNFGIQ